MRTLSLLLTAAGAIVFANAAAFQPQGVTASFDSWRGFMSAVHTIPQVPAQLREVWTHGFESYTSQMQQH
jgi:hypothetical protein